MKKNNGFILLEILVSIFIFSIGIVSLIKSLSIVTRTNQQVRNYTLSALITDNIFARIRAGEDISPEFETQMAGRKFNFQVSEKVLTNRLKQVSVKGLWYKHGQQTSTEFSQVIPAAE